jgi:hypothetical protein
MLSALVTRSTQSCFVLSSKTGETPETFLVDVVDVTIGSGGHVRVRLLPWWEPKIEKRTSLYFPHHRFPHVGIVYLTLLNGSRLQVKEKVKCSRSRRYHFLPLLYTYLSLPRITRANKILLQVLSDIAYPPATFCHHPALPSYPVPLQTLCI